MTKRYCIGCVHLNFSSGDRGQMGSEWTGRWGDEDPQLSCARQHWTLELPVGCGKTVFDIGKAMEKANDCADFEERPAP